MSENDQLRAAINRSIELSNAGQNERALQLLDEAIAAAIQEKRVSWVVTLSHHAAVISDFIGDTQRMRRYYEQSLAFEPENPMALYGLARVALKKGDTDVARRYATRCHKAILESDDEIVKQGLLDLVVKQWPEVTGG